MFSLSEYIYTQTNPKSGLIEKKSLPYASPATSLFTVF